MKKILFTACALIAFSLAGHAQTTRADGQADIDDKIQQEPPREPQRQVEKAAAPATPAQQNAQAQQQAEEKRKEEVERATGQPVENPAKKTKVVPEARLSQPDSKRLKTN